MKKYFFLAATIAAAAAFTSCDKSFEKQYPDIPAQTGKAELSLAIAGRSQTKATEAGTDAENAIGTVDIFVFFKGGEYDGRLDAYAHFDSAPYTLTATAGDRTVYAVINSEHSESVLEAISTKDELLEKVANLGSQKTAGNVPGMFTMVGSVVRSSATANPLVAGTNNVTVAVDRLVSRVRLRKITRAFDSPALAAQDFSIEEVYLSNAVSKDTYGSGYVPVADDFTNKLGVQDAAYGIWLRRAVSSSLADGASLTMNDASYSMYTMPNAIDADSEETPFSRRNTKLVVKASLDGKTLYYVLPLGQLKGNTTYDIGELVITRPGSSDPDKKTEVASCTFTVDVNPWTVVPLETESGKYVI